MPTTQYTIDDMMKMTSEIYDVQLQPFQVWNYKEVLFDNIGNWECIVFTYKKFNVSSPWCIQNGDSSPLWFTITIFSWTYGQWFMPTLLIHQSYNLLEELTYSNLGYWMAHTTYSGCMDLDIWMKPISHFRT